MPEAAQPLPKCLINTTKQAEEEMQKIGVSREGINLMSSKLIFKVIKLEKLDIRAANILKQEMLSAGGEVALSRGVIDFSVKFTDILLAGTLKQYQTLIKKLKKQPFGLSQIGEDINLLLKNSQKKTNNKKTKIMGILNITPDSFSDGGKYLDVDKAVAHALEMQKQGADIIDIGGESTKPGSKSISWQEELNRVQPVIKKLSKKTKIKISIDTTKPHVAEECLKAGASIINDISGLKNPEMIKIAAKYKVPVIIMHMQGNPRNMQKKPKYNDVVAEIKGFFKNKIKLAKKAGIKNIIIDPGIGFGKNLEHNLKILKNLDEFSDLGYPILVGPSRKSFINNISGLPVEDRLEGTLASIAIAINNGADIIRVHDVMECKRAAKIADAIKNI